MKTQLVFVPLSGVETELLAVFAADTSAGKKKDAKPEIRLLAAEDAPQRAAQAILAGGEFKAEAGETLLVHSPAGMKARRLLLVGLGKMDKVTPHEVRKAAGAAVRFVKPRGLREAAVAVPVADGLDSKLTVRALAEGALIADFDSDTYRSDRKDRSVQSLQVVAASSLDRAAVEAGLQEGVIVAESQNFARTLVNEPGNRLTPTILGERAAAMCREFGLRCEVYGADKLRELKMGAFLSVTQGSDEPPALIVMTYEPKDAPPGPVLGLVGKGITFDTGGISIKPADSMEKMKYDMAGAAAVLGAMKAIGQLKPAIPVTGYIPTVENMLNGNAQRPGDIVTSLSGKTIEVLNTDAEGRLILADAITYAKRHRATHIVDAATLTGAIGIALGHYNIGAFTNDQAFLDRVLAASRAAGEKTWQLPMDDEYKDYLKSAFADLPNIGGRYGGSITAAWFLREFADPTPWVHLDIASTAWLDDSKAWLSKGPTGVAVRSFVQLAVEWNA